MVSPAWQAFPREFVEKVGMRAKERTEGGRGGERRKRKKMRGVTGRTTIPA